LNRTEKGESSTKIGHNLKLAHMTVTTIIKDKDRIRDQLERGINNVLRWYKEIYDEKKRASFQTSPLPQ
ncbi:hypothetical protein SK128_008043, partial [Halocaridina rubra]